MRITFFRSNSGYSISELFQITHYQMVIRCSFLWKVRYTEFRWCSDIPDPLQSIFRLHCLEHFQRLPLFQGYSDPSHSDGNQILIILFRAKSDGCRFIRAFSDRLPTCIQMEVKLSEEIQINRLKTFQWLFKACLDIRWF